ncbi:MAG: hypothetical protein IJB73_07840 [Firmicutes bacterium]|nr:hypothetical protein [Bacillota bacterium]
MTKRLLCCLLAVCLVFTMAPAMAWADGESEPVTEPSPSVATLDISVGSITITENGFSQENGDTNDNWPGDYVITQTGTGTVSNYIHITGGMHNITLNDVNINGTKTIEATEANSLFTGHSTHPMKATQLGPFMVYGGADVTMTIKGTNDITSPTDFISAAVEVVHGSALTIEGEGTLNATATRGECNGIGSSRWRKAGTVTINSGTIVAKANGAYVSGLGPGRSQTGGSFIINGGNVSSSSGQAYAIGVSAGATADNVTIAGGTVTCTHGVGGTVFSVTGGNIITNATLPATDSNGRKLAKLYVVDTNGTVEANTEVEVTVNNGTPWKAITDNNGIINTYMLDTDTVNGSAKLPDGWLIGGNCVCDTADLTFTDMANEVDVYSEDVDVDVTVRGVCTMPIHKDVTAIVTIDSVTLENSTESVETPANYATYADGKLTLKPAGNTDNYTVKLSATRGGEGEEPVTHEIKVWASNTVGRKLNITNGSITVVGVTDTNNIKYTQGSNTFTVDKDTPVTITGKSSYTYAGVNPIHVKDCSPTIILKDTDISIGGNATTTAGSEAPLNHYVSTILIEGANTHATLLLSGENKISREVYNSSSHLYPGIEVKEAELTIDCIEGENCTDKNCLNKLFIVTANIGCRAAGIGQRKQTAPYGFTLNIDGGYIDVNKDGYGAAIGSCWVSHDETVNPFTINITDGYVKTYSSANGGGIGAKGNSQVNSGKVHVNIGGTAVVETILEGTPKNNPAIRGSSVTISENANITAKGSIEAKTATVTGNAKVDLQPTVGASGDGGIEGNLVVSGTAEVTAKGGVTGNVNVANGSYSNIEGTIKGTVTAVGGASVNGVNMPENMEGTIIIPGGSIGGLAVDEENDTITLPAGTTIKADDETETVIPENITSVTVPAAAVDEIEVKETEIEGTEEKTSSLILPEGSAVTQGTDAEQITTTIPSGGSVAEDGSISTEGIVITENTDGTVTTVDGDKVTTITPPSGSEDITVNTDGSVKVPADTVITEVTGTGENAVTTTTTVSAAGTVSADGNVTSEEGVVFTENPDGTFTVTDANDKTVTVEVPEGETAEFSDGTVTLPEGATVTEADGTVTTVPAGGSLEAEGTVTSETGNVITENAAGTEVTITAPDNNTTTITVPADKADELVVNADGTATLPEGSAVTQGTGADQTTTTIPAGGSVAADGSISTEGTKIVENADNTVTVTDKNGTTTTITPSEGGSVTVNPDGKVEVPVGSTITKGEGDSQTTVTIPSETGGSVTLPADKVDDVKQNSNGNVSLPSGTIVTDSEGKDTVMNYGGTINAEGKPDATIPYYPPTTPYNPAEPETPVEPETPAEPETPQTGGTETPAEKTERIINGVENTTVKAKSVKTSKGIKITWTKSKGYKVDYYEVYRSTKKSKGYGTKPIYTTKNSENPGTKTYYVNTKNLKKGTRYYYKVRGVRVVDGKKYYTEATKAWRTF